MLRESRCVVKSQCNQASNYIGWVDIHLLLLLFLFRLIGSGCIWKNADATHTHTRVTLNRNATSRRLDVRNQLCDSKWTRKTGRYTEVCGRGLKKNSCCCFWFFVARSLGGPTKAVRGNRGTSSIITVKCHDHHHVRCSWLCPQQPTARRALSRVVFLCRVKPQPSPGHFPCQLFVNKLPAMDQLKEAGRGGLLFSRLQHDQCLPCLF